MEVDAVRGYLEAALVAVLVVVGIFAWQEHADRIRAEAAQEPLRREAAQATALAQERDGAAEAAQVEATALRDSLGALGSVLSAKSDSLAAAMREVIVTVDVTSGEIGALLGEIREHLPEEARPLVDSVEVKVAVLMDAGLNAVEAFSQERVSFAAFRAQTEVTLASDADALTAANAATRQWQATAAAESARAANAERLATRGIWDRVRTSLPLFSIEGTIATATGFGLGWLATR